MPDLRQTVLHLIPQAGALQARAHQIIEVGTAFRQPMQARSIGDVVIDGLRKRVGLLEHHADAGAQLHHVLRALVNVLAVEPDLLR